MTRTALASVFALAACFSKPGYRDRDAGTGDDGTQLDAPDGGMTTAGPPKIAAGHHHACSIDAMTRLWCWGDNTFGQLGATAMIATGRPVLAFPGPSEALWSSVTAGDQHTCGIRNNTLYCWGNNDFMQSGGTNPPNTITLGAVATRVIAGRKSTCAVDTAKHIRCWGQIDPNTSGRQAITQIGPTQLEDWANVSLGSTHSCALTATGKVACWGNNDNRQLGEVGADRGVDAAIVLAGTYLQIAANERATCGITTAHNLNCVGSNATGLLSDQFDGNMTGTPTPVTVGGALSWSQIALGTDHACGITTSGVYCYGHSNLGAMGNGFTAHEPPALVTLPPALGAVTEVVAGQGFSCVRDVAGQVACWGSNKYGESADGSIASTKTPSRVELGLLATDQITAITTGDGHSCALITPAIGATTVKCWGDNRNRQVDSTTMQFRETPATSQTGLSSISSGELHTCGIKSGGDVTCWGSNASHQLSGSGGNGTITVDHTTTLTGEPFVQVGAGSTSTCAVTSPGQDLYCWGTMLPTFGNGTTPMKVNDSAHNWSEVALGSGFGIGKVDANELGGFGPGCSFGPTATAYEYDAPSPISNALTGNYAFTAAQSQGEHTCAMIDGASPIVRCWGSNVGHQIDDGAQVTCNAALEPGPLPASYRWATPMRGRIAAANAHTCALVDELPSTRIYCWGYNPGDLGFAEDNVGIPRKASGNLVATQLATGPNHICAIGRAPADTQDQVYCWGQNRTGEVGNGSRFHDTPVLVMFQ